MERTPEAIAARAVDVIRKGYTALKIDPFGSGSYEMSEDEKIRSVAIIAAVRDAIGPESGYLHRNAWPLCRTHGNRHVSSHGSVSSGMV